jgi:alkylhydroperoxidase family enzyme
VTNQYKAATQRMIETVLTTPGDAPSQLRQAVEARAATLGGFVQEGRDVEDVPPEVTTYVDKVARNAYKVTDADIDRLRQAGYSDDAIFEITLSVALGAGIGRLERGLGALKGDW